MSKNEIKYEAAGRQICVIYMVHPFQSATLMGICMENTNQPLTH